MPNQTISIFTIFLCLLACIRTSPRQHEPERHEPIYDYDLNQWNVAFLEGRMIIPRNGLSMEDMVNLVAFDYNVAKVTIDEELIDIIFPRVTHPDPRFITDVFLTLRVIINYLILLDFWGLEMVDAKTGVMRRNENIWFYRSKNLEAHIESLPQIVSFLAKIGLRTYAEKFATIMDEELNDGSIKINERARTIIFSLHNIFQSIQSAPNYVESPAIAYLMSNPNVIQLANRMEKNNIQEWINGQHSISREIPNGEIFTVFKWYSQQCYGLTARLPLREAILRAQSSRFFERHHQTLLKQMFMPIGDGDENLNEEELERMRLSEEVLEQVGVAVNIFLAFVGIEIKDHLNYQFDFNYDQTKPGLKELTIRRFEMVKGHIRHIIELLKNLRMLELAEKIACLFNVKIEMLDEHEFLHRKGYLDILPRTTHSYTEFYQDRAKTAHGGLPFIELYNEMTNFDYIISSHSEASLMFPLYEDSNQRPLSDDEKNLFRHDLQLQFTVLEAVSVVLHHIGIKFPDPAKPSPKILTTDNEQLLQISREHLKKEYFQAFLLRMIKFLDRVHLYNYSIIIARGILKLLKHEQQGSIFHEMHPSTQKKLIETSVRNRVDDKFVPIIIFCRKEDRKERREKGEQIEEEGEDEIILEQEIIFGSPLRREFRESKALDPRDPTSPVIHNVVHIKDRQRRRMHKPERMYEFPESHHDGIRGHFEDNRRGSSVQGHEIGDASTSHSTEPIYAQINKNRPRPTDSGSPNQPVNVESSITLHPELGPISHV